MSASDPERFVLENTAIERPPLLPEIALRLASEVVPLWQASEAELAEKGIPPPYWAFAWAGGQGLARYILDHPETVAGKRVLDFAAGSGLAGIAAAKAGASTVAASEIDPFALAAIAANAALNEVTIDPLARDVVDESGWDVILAGDVCYEKPMAERVFSWLRAEAAMGACVLLGDPGRSYLPRQGLARVIAYSVKTTRELEDTDLRNAVVWRVTDEPA